MKAISKTGTKAYVCKSEEGLPTSEQTVFKIGFLSVTQDANLNDLTEYQDGKMILNTGAKMLLWLHYGLVSVENMFNEDGTAFKLERDTEANVLPDGITKPWKTSGANSLGNIPDYARAEIVNVIRDFNTIKEPEAKN